MKTHQDFKRLEHTARLGQYLTGPSAVAATSLGRTLRGHFQHYSNLVVHSIESVELVRLTLRVEATVSVDREHGPQQVSYWIQYEEDGSLDIDVS